MSKLPPPIPAQFQQPGNQMFRRECSDSGCESVSYVEKTHYRIWFNNQFEGYAPHHHEAMELLYCVDQTYDVTVNNKLIHMRVGDILLIPPHMMHEIHYAEAGSRFIGLFDLSILDFFDSATSLRPFFMEPCLCTSNKNPAIYKQVYDLVRKAIDLYFQNELVSEMEIYSVLLQIISILTRDFYSPSLVKQDAAYTPSNREHYDRILCVLNYIEEKYSEDISLEQAADLSGFSKFHFARIFKEQTNSTFYDYLIHRRVHAAQSLLYSDMSITEIAFQTGFNNSTTFYRSFKKVIGISPSDYRNQILNEPEEEIISYEKRKKIEELRNSN